MSLLQSSLGAFRRSIQGSGTVDSQGNCVIRLPPANRGTIETGSITIYDSPGSAVWNKILNGQIVDTVVGQSTCGNIQVGNGDDLRFETSALNGFTGQTFHATFLAVVSSEENTNLVIPGHDSLPSITLPPRQIINGINYTVPGGGGPPTSFDIPLLTSDQSLILGVGVNTGPAVFRVTGNTTGFVYLLDYKLFSGQFFSCPVYGSLDSTVHINITGITGNVIVTIAAMPENLQMGSQAQPNNILDINGPETGFILAVAANTAGGVPLLPTPPTNLLYALHSAQIVSNSTAAAATVMRIFGASSGASILSTYPTANGTSALWVGELRINEAINGANNSTTPFNAHLWYRTEPL